jgi:hypothetical protein
MARKKNRPPRQTLTATPPSAPVSSTAVVAQGAVTGVAQTPSRKPPRIATGDQLTPEASFRATATGRFFIRLFRVFASLQLAISLLALFTLSLILATLLESWYNAEIAQQLIYRAWWFTFLLFLLGTNIFCAAMKKMDVAKLKEGVWPWKKYQTGFLITHAGLIILVFGGLLTALGGEEGQMIMADTDNPSIQRKVGAHRTTDRIYLTGEYTIDVLKVKAGNREVVADALSRFVSLPDEVKSMVEARWSMAFTPGALPWHEEDGFRANMPWGVRLLRGIASPVRSYSRDIGDAELRVTNFYPTTEVWPYSAAPDGAAHSFPALMLRLQSPMMGAQSMPMWVTEFPQRSGFPINFELFRLPSPTLLKEFLNPPTQASKDMGKDGQLVLTIDGVPGRVFRIPVDSDKLNTRIKLPGTDLVVKITDIGNLADEIAKRAKGHGKLNINYPLVKFELSNTKESTGRYQCCARQPDMPLSMQEEGKPAEVAAWYHTPDPFWGESRKGALQVLLAPDGKLYYRVWGSRGVLRQKGKELDPSDTETEYTLPWEVMKMTMRVGAFLPRAVRTERYTPVNLSRLGAKAPEHLKPAIVGVIAVRGKDYPFQARLERDAAEVVVDNDVYLINYRQAVKTVDFKVRLNRAIEEKDPGSMRSASFRSEITLIPKEGPEKDYALYMNHTMDHAGFRFFQANFVPSNYEDNGRKVNVTGLTLASDPGLWFKYAGSLIVVLGIATMFYMKAYFFKPRGRASVELAPPAGPVPT